MFNNFFADIFVVKCVLHIIREAKVVCGVMDLRIYDNVLLLGFFFFVEADEGSESEICDGDNRIVIHNSFRSLEGRVGYVPVRRKDQ
ncbi:conserved hypothetical protein [Vibrio coralliirubri]|nr:conserved hypothetical protein [Vibrio coralliirubri]